MKRAMAIWLAGAIAAAGLLVPRGAAAHGGDGRGACRDEGGGAMGRDMDGMMGMMVDGGMGAGRGEGMGLGAMGGGLGPIWQLELTDVQRTHLTRITDALRRAHWATMGKMLDARARLRDLEAQPQPDPKQVGAAFGEVSKLRQEMVEASVRARNEVRAVLTPPQREQLDKWRTRARAPYASAGERRSGAGRSGGADAGDHEEHH